MAITTQQLADLLGISRGTVDRALHHRGRVSPEMQKRIEEAARKYGYEPSAMAKALARAKNPVKIGFVLHLASLPFSRQMLDGVQAAAAELANLGGVVLLEELESLVPALHIEAVDRLVAQGAQGLAITPVEDAALVAHLNQLSSSQGLEIVTVNTDASGIKRASFVGLDNLRSGETAAGLLHLLLGQAGGKVLILSGSIANKTNSQRVDGFVQLLAGRHPEIQVSSIQFNGDDEQEAFRVVDETLRLHPDLGAIYMVSSGQAGACRALQQAGREDVRMVVFDTVPDTVEYIQKGAIDFIIDQNPFQQGSLPPRLLFDSLFAGKKITQQHHYTEISIKTQYNL